MTMTVYLGIDWSKDHHDLAFMNEAGQVILQARIEHSGAGFWELDGLRRRLQVTAADCLVGIETIANLIVDYLQSQGYPIYLVAPRKTAAVRGRHRSSRAHTDCSDAILLADMVRTDRHRLRLWQPNERLTRELAAQVGLIQHLTKSRLRLANRLRARLALCYPAALSVFSRLDQALTLAFLAEYPTPQAAQALSQTEFEAFARKQRYPQPARLAACYARLQAGQIPLSAEGAEIYAAEIRFLVRSLQDILQTKKATLKSLRTLFEQHPDQAIFASLPGAGDLLAPALLTKFGDHRSRFPSPESVQSLAGTCPVTIQSGKRRQVRYRYACDRNFRQIAVQFAKSSLLRSPWASTYFQKAQARGVPVSQTYRALANRWLAVIWKLWQTRQEYDGEYHLRQTLLRARPI